jgi:hypothetical protein
MSLGLDVPVHTVRFPQVSPPGPVPFSDKVSGEVFSVTRTGPSVFETGFLFLKKNGSPYSLPWVVDQLTDLFRTTHHTKTQHVTKSRGRHFGDIQLTDYLVNTVGPVSLVLDLRITHDRFGSSTDPSLNIHLHYPNDIEKSLNEDATDKIQKYRADYNNNPPNVVSFMSVIASTFGRLHCEFIRLLFLQAHRETDHLFAATGVQLAQTDRGLFHFHGAVFSSTLKSKVDNNPTQCIRVV